MAAEKDPRKCMACEIDVENNPKLSFCRLHLEAYENVVKSYDKWRNAYGDLPPEEFLKRLKDNDYTGKWVREVAHIILSNSSLLQFFSSDMSY